MFPRHEFSHEYAPKFSHFVLSISFVDPKKTLQTAKYPTMFPCKKQEDFTDELLQARRGENITAL